MGNQCSTGVCLLKEEESSEMKFADIETNACEGLEVGDIVRAPDGSKGFTNDEGVEVYKAGDEGKVRKFFKSESSGQERIKIAWMRTNLTSTCPSAKWSSRFALVRRGGDKAENAKEAKKEAGSVLALATSGTPIPQTVSSTGVKKAPDTIPMEDDVDETSTTVSSKQAEVERAVTAATSTKADNQGAAALPAKMAEDKTGVATNKAEEEKAAGTAVAAQKSEEEKAAVAAARKAEDEKAAAAAVAAQKTEEERAVASDAAAKNVEQELALEEQALIAAASAVAKKIEESSLISLEQPVVECAQVDGAAAEKVENPAPFDLALEKKDLTKNISEVGSTQAESEPEESPQAEEEGCDSGTHADTKPPHDDFRSVPAEYFAKLHSKFERATLGEDSTPLKVVEKVHDVGFADLLGQAAEAVEDPFSFVKPAMTHTASGNAKIEDLDNMIADCQSAPLDTVTDMMTDSRLVPVESASFEACPPAIKYVAEDEAVQGGLVEQALPWNFKPSVGTWFMPRN